MRAGDRAGAEAQLRGAPAGQPRGVHASQPGGGPAAAGRRPGNGRAERIGVQRRSVRGPDRSTAGCRAGGDADGLAPAQPGQAQLGTPRDARSRSLAADRQRDAAAQRAEPAGADRDRDADGAVALDGGAPGPHPAHAGDPLDPGVAGHEAALPVRGPGRRVQGAPHADMVTPRPGRRETLRGRQPRAGPTVVAQDPDAVDGAGRERCERDDERQDRREPAAASAPTAASSPAPAAPPAAPPCGRAWKQHRARP